MEDLLPYYERELGIFRAYTREFAARFPRTAGHLLIAGETCEDPHIERLIQSFALLTARVAKRLDDDYPQLTEALLETLYPHYLRPFPSCSIARIEHVEGHDRDGILRVPRGTVMQSLPVRGVKCRFTSAYDVVIAPVALTVARFDAIIDAPATVRLPDGAGAAIHLVIESVSPLLDLHHPPVPALRLFVDGEPSFRAALIDALFLRQAGAWVEWDSAAADLPDGRWHPLERLPLRAAGYAEQEALIPYPERSHPAFRLLTEYFSFPEKFHFIDIDLAALATILPPGCRRCTLHLPLRGLRSDSNAARLLAPLSAKHLMDGCTPVVNLFAKSGVPVRLTQTDSDYPVLADATHAFGYEVHTITAARLVRHGGDAGTALYPLYAARHDDGTPDGMGDNTHRGMHHGSMHQGGMHQHSAQHAGPGNAEYPRAQQPGGPRRHYWLARRDDSVAAISPGHEMRISLVDGKAAGEADGPATRTNVYTGATLALDLLCTNRDLPASLRYGLPNGDLLSDVVPDGLLIGFLRKPSAPQRFASGAGAHWRLISHLSLNYSGLTDAGVEEFRRMLCLYDLAQSAISQRQINGIVGLQHGSTRAWMPGVPFATLMPGVRLRMRIDEQAFVGSGLFVFAQVMDRYFGLNSQLNCFTQLDIVSHKTGEELIRCPARTAQSTLT